MDKDSKKTPLQEEIAKEAIKIVDHERTNWEEAVSYVTPQVGFRMRQLIRTLRKNYWGVFDEPIDKYTGREKVWVGLAQATVETWVKNVDLDTKDIGFIARTPEGYEITDLTRIVVKDYLDRMYFGEIIDADERQVLIDGTVVWKTWEDRVKGKPVMKRRTVDLLNFYIDPTEENIQTAYRVTERAVLLPEQIASMDGWMNTDIKNLPGSQTLAKNDGYRKSNFGTKSTGEFRDVWECWGKIPKWLITGDRDDVEEIDGHIVVSGLEAPNPTLHLVEENTRKDKFGNVIKPYEEWRAAKISGRWYGLGVIERILALQEYLNAVVNIRINKHYVSQLGLFKIKKGKGITAQMLNRLPTTGAIPVTDMDDIAPMETPGEDGTSYRDEEVIKGWAQNISSAFPVTNGDTLPASTTATVGAISSAAAKSGYSLFKEGTGMFFERWIDRQALPIIAKGVTVGDIMRVDSADEKYHELVANIAYNNVAEALDKSNIVPSHEEMLAILAHEEEVLKKKPQIFVKAVKKIMAESVDTKVHVTNEDIDTGVTVQNLLQLAQIAPEAKDDAIKQVYDLLGLERPVFKAPQPQQGIPSPMQQAQPNMVNQMQQANTPING